jgi:hypothetical protein
LSLFGFSAANGWMVFILTRDYGQTPQQVGSIMGTVGLATTLLGFFVSTIGLRRFAVQAGLGFPSKTTWTAHLGVFCRYIALAFSSSALHICVLQGASGFLLILANRMYPSALQGLAPAPMRARAVAIQFVLAAVARAAAAPLVGLLSDQLKAVPNGTMPAAVGVGGPCLLAGVALLRWCQRNHYEQTAKDSFDSDALAVRVAQSGASAQLDGLSPTEISAMNLSEYATHDAVELMDLLQCGELPARELHDTAQAAIKALNDCCKVRQAASS